MEETDIFVPSNDLEVALFRTISGESQMGDFLRVFLRARIAVPSTTEAMPDGTGFAPLLFDRLGQQMLAVFTDKDRAKQWSETASFALRWMAIIWFLECRQPVAWC